MKPGMYSVTHENVITVPIWAELGIIPGRTKNQLDCRICHCALKETSKPQKFSWELQQQVLTPMPESSFLNWFQHCWRV